MSRIAGDALRARIRDSIRLHGLSNVAEYIRENKGTLSTVSNGGSCSLELENRLRSKLMLPPISGGIADMETEVLGKAIKNRELFDV